MYFVSASSLDKTRQSALLALSADPAVAVAWHGIADAESAVVQGLVSIWECPNLSGEHQCQTLLRSSQSTSQCVADRSRTHTLVHGISGSRPECAQAKLASTVVATY